MSLSVFPIRILCDAAGETSAPSVVDVQTGNEPNLRQGADVEIDIALAENDVVLTGISNVASVTLSILSAVGGSVLLTQTINSGALNAALTPANWANGTDQHAAFKFTATQTASLGLVAGQASLPFWLLLVATTTDMPAKIINIAEGEIIISL